MNIRDIAALSLLGLSGCHAAAGEAREDPASIFVCSPVAVPASSRNCRWQVPRGSLLSHGSRRDP